HRVVQALPRMAKDLPRLMRAKGFIQRTAAPAFTWQNKAFDLATGLADASCAQGFFGVNMASTGTGKTLANGRIMYGLADPEQGARFCVALGLRTLTLQTGEAFRDRLKLDADALAVLVGGAAVRQLYDRERVATEVASPDATVSHEARGSESAAVLSPDDGYVVYEGALSEGPLSEWLSGSDAAGRRQNNAQKMVEAPILVCTVDHIMPSVESTRGGHQIAPMLRLLTSDLVLDEVDDFGMEDLPALARLTYWAGMLGSRILLSSATLPPALVQGLFAAYLAGRSVYQVNRGPHTLTAPQVICAWFDEFGCESSAQGDEEGMQRAHAKFVRVRVERLARQPARRHAEVVKIVGALDKSGQPISTAEIFGNFFIRQAWGLHQKNAQTDARTGARVSFGLIRMANISPLWEIAHRLLKKGGGNADLHVHLCVYHSRHPLVVRSRIESVLDTVLRRDPDDPQAIFKHRVVRNAIDTYARSDHLFIVLATAVAEVGRDHDYDWAVVEPSSMRSIIQLAGRIRRHRTEGFESINLAVLNFNWRGLESPQAVAFTRPGYEKANHFALAHHELGGLLHESELKPLTARPRIVEPDVLNCKYRLSDLEHARLRASLLEGDKYGEHDVRQFWKNNCHLTGYDQACTPFRLRHGQDSTFAFVPDDDGELCFMREQNGQWTDANGKGHHLQRVEIVCGSNISVWPAIDLAAEIDALAIELSCSPSDCAKRFARVDLLSDPPYKYSPGLGFTRA
ncbi:MAG: type I-F CRISPR-associated helicase Cas3, partial [Aeromicrobium sp.]|nr:type I-F CRISPR-associated helicase Cas3 [Burkholderiales bacterium]